MKDVMKYKGFIGSAELDPNGSVHGKILFISDLVTYEAHSAKEITVEFEAAVEDYLETCKSLDRDPV
jgi:predicted HicB family RNase H-like nuclease